MELKSIDVLSCGKMLGAMYAIMGLIGGGVLAMVSLLGAAAGGGPQNGNPLVMFGAGVGAVIMLPIFYGVLGFVGGIISAFAYNTVAGIVGGVEFNFEPKRDQFG